MLFFQLESVQAHITVTRLSAKEMGAKEFVCYGDDKPWQCGDGDYKAGVKVTWLLSL